MDDLTQAHRDYWKESQAGTGLMNSLVALIYAEHAKAEKAQTLEESYKHTQRAGGITEAISTINSLTAGMNRGTQDKQ